MNSIGCLRMAELALATRCRHVVYLSTISTYEHPDNQCFGSYGLSKRHGQENLAFACRHSGIGLTTLLPSQLYDELGEARRHQPLLYHVLDCARDGKAVTLYGKKDPYRNFLFVEDLVSIIEQVVLQGLTGNFDCVHPKSYRISEVAQIAFDIFGKGGSVQFDGTKSDLPTLHIPAAGELYDRISYTPQTDLRSALSAFEPGNRGKAMELC